LLPGDIDTRWYIHTRTVKGHSDSYH
jgi:hypothetical protein